jgi:ABC-2 type transport system ATP-binding protein
VVILDAGQVRAEGTPADIRARAPARDDREPTMEDAFIAIVEEARRREPPAEAA